MALRTTGDSWYEFLVDAGIPNTESEQYAKIIHANRIVDPQDLSKDLLRELGITIAGDVIAIVKAANKLSTTALTGPQSPPTRPSTASLSKPAPIKPPQLKSEMTHPEWRKFRIDWSVFTTLTNLATDQIAPQIYHACDDDVQNAIINTSADFLTLGQDAIMDILEKIVTKRSNPTVHRMSFSSIVQSENESIKDFFVRLNSSAKDCEFTCPNCQYDLLPVNVKDQFTRGLRNSTLQTDILAKSSSLKTLEEILIHSEAFETALDDQSKLQDTSEVLAGRTSEYKSRKFRRPGDRGDQPKWPDSGDQTSRPDNRNRFRRSDNSQRNKCNGCGSTSHGAIDRSTACPAWGKTCLNCNTPNHFASVCRQAKRESANAIIAHVEYHDDTDSYTTASAINNIHEIAANITPILPNSSKNTRAKQMMIFPDSGAGICLAGPVHLSKLGIDPRKLIPCRKKVTAVGGSTLTCRGWLPMRFSIRGHTTQQPLYVCDKIDRIYFSRQGCTETNILPASFPYPMGSSSDMNAVSPKSDAPTRPNNLPFPATEENIPKLRDHLVTKFSTSVFNKATPFRAMNCKPAHIHLKEDATPFASCMHQNILTSTQKYFC